MAVSDQEKGADERIARLYREAAHEEPPSHLDKAIYGAARASARPPASRAQTWLRSWRLPFAFVAVGIVSVSLVTLMVEEGGERLTPVPQRPIAAKPEGSAELDAPPSAAGSVPAEQRVQRDSPPPPAANRTPTRERAKPLQENTEHRKADSAATARQSHAEDASSVRPRAGMGAAATPRRSDELRGAQKAPEASAPSTGPAAGAATDGSAAPAAKPAPAAPAVLAAPPPPAAARMRKSEEAGLRADAASEIAKLAGEPPAVWLERIVILRREGRQIEADALLAEFKVRFPGAALPPQLQ